MSLADSTGILAESNVPEVILDAARLGMSDADNDSLAEGTVPLPRFDAFKLVKLAPEPLKVDASTSPDTFSFRFRSNSTFA